MALRKNPQEKSKPGVPIVISFTKNISFSINYKLGQKLNKYFGINDKGIMKYPGLSKMIKLEYVKRLGAEKEVETEQELINKNIKLENYKAFTNFWREIEDNGDIQNNTLFFNEVCEELFEEVDTHGIEYPFTKRGIKFSKRFQKLKKEDTEIENT